MKRNLLILLLIVSGLLFPVQAVHAESGLKIVNAKNASLKYGGTKKIVFDVFYDGYSLPDDPDTAYSDLELSFSVIGAKCIKVTSHDWWDSKGYAVYVKALKSGTCTFRIKAKYYDTWTDKTVTTYKDIKVTVAKMTKNQKEVIKAKKTIKAYMNAVESYNTKKIISYFQPRKYRKGFITWENCATVDLVRFLHNKYYLYEIKNVTIKGKSGYAKVDVTYYDAYYLYSEAMTDMTYKWFVYHRKASSKEIHKKIYYYALRSYKSDPDRDIWETSKIVKIPLVKRNGKWKIQKMTKAMQAFTDCRTVESLNDRN